jgi:hypothetical protein
MKALASAYNNCRPPPPSALRRAPHLKKIKNGEKGRKNGNIDQIQVDHMKSNRWVIQPTVPFPSESVCHEVFENDIIFSYQSFLISPALLM